ncbi:CysB family HTH-type transcriptional regulator [Paucibacter sp. DJ2R-2]|uniref:CysB family HTH-type transcriptional regulator n=1 Tax=Paucibacter sp. DJ2R-2 TaxID=2893558 RepID=UPI0021E4EC19|nr:CysB family HTH-type transcriptional regulator [Paucibacter sp. DJ2R-2]MCV2422655.1 CysB family HTH-type transcriptional regulator [Paucibacter sp. DJ4R-1]MCV2438853.1 CysB family HTH-type transcriptional regulator [Paucibacter sp. DJ2R-2]
MNFQQLRSIREAQRRGFNLTEVAHALHTSQPGVSRQIRELEDELGIEIFMRAGKRLTGLTEPGRHVLPIIERMLHEADNLRRAGDDFARTGVGTLRIAATHSQARYALPPVVRDFRAAHPDVALHLHQGSPQQVARLLLDGEADIGIATEALAQYDELIALPCYRWTHSVVVPPDHALAKEAAEGQVLTLERLSKFPIITYELGYTGRSHIDDAFRAAGLELNVVLAAMDADVIKTYVELGLGVGIVASIAYDDERDLHLSAIDARHLFADNMTRLAVRRGAYLRDYVYAFMSTFAAPLTREAVEAAAQESASPASL